MVATIPTRLCCSRSLAQCGAATGSVIDSVSSTESASRIIRHGRCAPRHVVRVLSLLHLPHWGRASVSLRLELKTPQSHTNQLLAANPLWSASPFMKPSRPNQGPAHQYRLPRWLRCRPQRRPLPSNQSVMTPSMCYFQSSWMAKRQANTASGSQLESFIKLSCAFRQT